MPGAGQFPNVKMSADCVQQFFAGVSVPSGDDPVVIVNPQLIRGEEYGEEVVKFLIPGIIRVCLPAFETGFYCGGGTVMAVCDINMPDPGE